MLPHLPTCHSPKELKLLLTRKDLMSILVREYLLSSKTEWYPWNFYGHTFEPTVQQPNCTQSLNYGLTRKKPFPAGMAGVHRTAQGTCKVLVPPEIMTEPDCWKRPYGITKSQQQSISGYSSVVVLYVALFCRIYFYHSFYPTMRCGA